jgi:hypothetical protein
MSPENLVDDLSLARSRQSTTSPEEIRVGFLFQDRVRHNFAAEYVGFSIWIYQ